MRYLALTLALCFAIAPMQAAARHSSPIHTVKSKKNKNAHKIRKSKRPATHTAQRAN